MTSILFDGETHSSSFCQLLDFGRGTKVVEQVNPFDNTLRYFWNFPFAGENENEQSAGKNF